MKIGLFLGAGASVPYGKPTTKEFKSILLNKYTNTDKYPYLIHLLDHEKLEDIEQVLQCLKETKIFLENGWGKEFFSTRNEQYTTPICGNYKNSTIDFTNDFFISEIKTIQTIIQDEIFEQYTWNENKQINLVLTTLLDNLFSIINKNNEINIFTTNYDNAIETYRNENKYKYKLVDSFSHDDETSEYFWNNNFISDSNKTHIFLHKLHGSLDWQDDNKRIFKTKMEAKSAIETQRNVLIYPTLSPKEEEQQEPYKSLIHRFKKFVQNSDVFIVIGYSFRDSLNDTFLDFLKKGNKKLIVISPSASDEVHSNLLEKDNVSHSEVEFDIIPYKNEGKVNSEIICMNMKFEGEVTLIILQKVFDKLF